MRKREPKIDTYFFIKTRWYDKPRKYKKHNKKYHVYFLWNQEILVYIGATSDLYPRVAKHKSLKKLLFTDVGFIEVARDKMLKIEKMLTRLMKPSHNIRNLDPITRR